MFIKRKSKNIKLKKIIEYNVKGAETLFFFLVPKKLVDQPGRDVCLFTHEANVANK